MDNLVEALPFLILGGVLFGAVIYWLNHRNQDSSTAGLRRAGNDDDTDNSGLIFNAFNFSQNSSPPQSADGATAIQQAALTNPAASDSSDSASNGGDTRDSSCGGACDSSSGSSRFDSGGSDSGGSCGGASDSSSDS